MFVSCRKHIGEARITEIKMEIGCTYTLLAKGLVHTSVGERRYQIVQRAFGIFLITCVVYRLRLHYTIQETFFPKSACFNFFYNQPLPFLVYIVYPQLLFTIKHPLSKLIEFAHVSLPMHRIRYSGCVTKYSRKEC
jgi:hypothetical protein